MHGFTIAFVFSYFCSYDVVSGSFKVCAMKSKPKIRFHYWAFCLFLSFSSIFVYVCVCVHNLAVKLKLYAKESIITMWR